MNKQETIKKLESIKAIGNDRWNSGRGGRKMSEFKEKILSEISFAMVDDAPDLQKLYDKVAATDEHSELNDNQQIVLEWLKLTVPTGKPMQVVFWMMNNAAWGHLDELRDPLMELTDKEQFEVLAAFAQWGLEKEEVG